MATQKFSDLTTTTTPNAGSVFAIAYSGANYKLTITDLAANLPATTVTSLTSSGNITVTGDLTVSGDDITMNTNTSGAALIADGTNFNPVVISGDIAIASGGGATIQATSVEGSMLNNNVISGQTEITSGLADADELLYSDAGVLKKVGMDTAKSFFHSSTATAITVADESSDTTCFPVFVTAATGDLPPKSGTNLAFNSSSGVLTATGFAGALTGNVTGNASGSSGSCTGNSATATTTTNVTVADESSDTTCFPLFATAATGDLAPKSGSNLSFNSATGALTATSFVGTSPTATVITVADESSDTTCFPLFVTAATGDLGPKSAAGLTFNSSTDVLAGTFSGNITGNVTGNTSGSAGSCTGLSATSTALATGRNFSLTGNVTASAVSFDGTGVVALSTTLADATVTSAKLSGALVTPSSLDINGNELILDADADTSITADTDDQIDFKIAGVEHISLTNSSGDTIIKPRVDAKDIIFQQFDGTSILEINDGAYAKFTSAGIVPEATLTDASTITWNALTQSVSKVTLGANRIMGLASGGVTGAFISLLIIQDGTGSRTITWNAAYEFTGDAAPTLTTTAAKGDLFVFRYNGAKWLETGRNLNLTLS